MQEAGCKRQGAGGRVWVVLVAVVLVLLVAQEGAAGATFRSPVSPLPTPAPRGAPVAPTAELLPPGIEIPPPEPKEDMFRSPVPGHMPSPGWSPGPASWPGAFERR